MSKSTDKKPAKICYGHVGGKLGILLMETFADKGWIIKANPNDKHFYISELGQLEFTKLGVDLSKIKSEE